MKTIIVIPARYGSSRYAGKPLIKLLNKTNDTMGCGIKC